MIERAPSYNSCRHAAALAAKEEHSVQTHCLDAGLPTTRCTRRGPDEAGFPLDLPLVRHDGEPGLCTAGSEGEHGKVAAERATEALCARTDRLADCRACASS